MKCPVSNCGAKVPPGASFCPRCGSDLQGYSESSRSERAHDSHDRKVGADPATTDESTWEQSIIDRDLAEAAQGALAGRRERDGAGPAARPQRPSMLREVGALYMTVVAMLAGTVFVALTGGATQWGPYAIASAFGAAILPFLFGVLLTGIFWLVGVRSRRILQSLYAIVAVGSALVAAQGDRQAEKDSLSIALRRVTTQIGSATNSPNLPKVDIPQNRKSEASTVISLLESAVSDAKLERDRFSSRLNAIVNGGLIKPRQLDSSADIAALRAKLKELNKLMDDFEAWYRGYNTKFLRELTELNISDRAKNIAVRGYHESKLTTDAHVKEFLAIERAVFDDFAALGAFMESRLGRFSTDAQNVYFRDPADLAEYQEIIKRIQQGVAEEARIQKLMQDNLQTRVGQLNDLAAELER